MKEFNQIVLQKEFFASIKEHLCLTKGHLDNPEGQVEVEPPNRKLFLISFIHIRKNVFSKMALLTKRPIPRRFTFAKYALSIVKEYS